MKLLESKLDDTKCIVCIIVKCIVCIIVNCIVGITVKAVEFDAKFIAVGEGDGFAQGVYEETPHEAVTWYTEKEIRN
jgi:hypothetical protein